MRGGSGAAGPAGASAGANAKGNILHLLLNQSLILCSKIYVVGHSNSKFLLLQQVKMQKTANM